MGTDNLVYSCARLEFKTVLQEPTCNRQPTCLRILPIPNVFFVYEENLSRDLRMGVISPCHIRHHPVEHVVVIARPHSLVRPRAEGACIGATPARFELHDPAVLEGPVQ
jgi:hypothetical protein